MNTRAHGGLTEPSLSYHGVTHDRKGREGNRKGSGGEIRSWSPLHHGVGLGDVAFRLGMMVIDKFYADGWTEVTVREDLGPCWEYNGTRDMVSKGRHHYPHGDDHHRTVLTDEQVREMRDNYTGERGEMSRLAEQYGITGNQVSLILRGLRRKEAPGRIHPKRWRAGGWLT